MFPTIPFLGSGGAGEEAAHYQALFELQPEGTFILDQNRRIVRANPAARRLFSTPGRDLSGRAFTELIDARSRSAIEQALDTAIGGALRPPVVGADALGADGRAFPVAISVGGLRKEAGGGFQVVVQDYRDRTGAAPRPAPAFTFGGLLVAERLKELV